jgi:hypothetical protein
MFFQHKLVKRIEILEKELADLKSLLLAWGITITPEGRTDYSPKLKQFQKTL